MRTIWIASGVFLAGALACALLRRVDIALIFATLGFQAAYFADSNIDWKRRITRRNWRETLFESRFRTTVLAKLAQALSFVCLFFFFVATSR